MSIDMGFVGTYRDTDDSVWVRATNVSTGVQEYLGICLNTSNLAASQYGNYNFNSLVKFNGAYLGANADGIFELGGTDSDSDNGDSIASVVRLIMSDFGTTQQKRIRSGYVGYEANGDMEITFTTDDEGSFTYTLTPVKLSNREHGNKFIGNRDYKGRYWEIKFENSAGCDFSLDSITLVPTYMAKKPSGTRM